MWVNPASLTSRLYEAEAAFEAKGADTSNAA